MKTDQKDSPAEQSVYSRALTYMGDDRSKFAKALSYWHRFIKMQGLRLYRQKTSVRFWAWTKAKVKNHECVCQSK